VSRPRNLVPTYRKHSTKNEARCWVDGRWITLGRWKSPESLQAYERLCAELRVRSAAVVQSPARGLVCVSRVVLEFFNFAAVHYRYADGSVTPELYEYELAVRPLCDLYGSLPADQFGPLALQAYRNQLIRKNWCRTRVNKQVGRVRRIFKWAAGQELDPPSVPQALACVQGLQRGRCAARETEPVKPVPVADVLATLPFLNRHVRAAVELQLHTGMRPGEACSLTLGQIDRSDEMWVYRPDQHKTLHKGKERMIPLGPKARVVLTAFMGDRVYGPDEPLFNPRVAREERYATMRAKRRSKVQPSQVSRKKAKPQRVPPERYSGPVYATTVTNAAVRAGVPAWHPNQLRHTYATQVRKAFGLEAAQVLLGHSKADVTQIYAEKNHAMAAEVAGKIG
jgi:integrase